MKYIIISIYLLLTKASLYSQNENLQFEIYNVNKALGVAYLKVHGLELKENQIIEINLRKIHDHKNNEIPTTKFKLLNKNSNYRTVYTYNFDEIPHVTNLSGYLNIIDNTPKPNFTITNVNSKGAKNLIGKGLFVFLTKKSLDSIHNNFILDDEYFADNDFNSDSKIMFRRLKQTYYKDKQRYPDSYHFITDIEKREIKSIHLFNKDGQRIDDGKLINRGFLRQLEVFPIKIKTDTVDRIEIFTSNNVNKKIVKRIPFKIDKIQF